MCSNPQCKSKYADPDYWPEPPNFKRKKGLAFSYDPSVEVSPGLWFCEKQNLWWKDGITYDQRSAEHNGLIGMGAQLKQLLTG